MLKYTGENMNYLAIGGAALASMAVGMLWYSPVMFGKPWMKMMGFKTSDMKKMKLSPTASMITGLVTALVLSFVMAKFASTLQISTAAGGAVLGFWVWLGFFATTSLGSVLWENKPFALYLINVSYQLVQVLLTAVIVSMF